MPQSAYKPVRGLARGLAVLDAMNHARGGFARIADIATHCNIHRTTVKRLLETLAAEGYVRRSEADDRYVLTNKVRALADGFTDDEWIGQAAAPVLGDLLKKIVWPTDIATLDGDAMVIRESTHRFSPLAFHRAIVGMRLPLLYSALGRAYLAHCPREERETLLAMHGEAGREVRAMLTRTRQAGFAANDLRWQSEREVVALAVPIRRGPRVIACLSVVYRQRAVAAATAIERFVPALKTAARQIEARLVDLPVVT